MSNNFKNFADKNPFEDPAVLEALKIETNNPNAEPLSQNVDQAISQAILGPPQPYNPSTSYTAGSYDMSAASELKRKQEELERKAAELQRREDEMQRNVLMQARINNFPPLPSSCPLQPCFHHDISIDIPASFQALVKKAYFLWIAYIGLLVVNTLVSLLYLISSSVNNIPNSSGSTFALSIFLAIIFVPCSFVCWFRPLYNAFRIDSSFNFFVFFFIFSFQCCVCLFQALGLSGWGTVGIVSSISMMSCGRGGCVFVGVMMLFVGAAFVALASLNILLLTQVHRIYRSTGASFSKAQQEFSSNIVNNSNIQQAARNFIAGNPGNNKATPGGGYEGGVGGGGGMPADGRFNNQPYSNVEVGSRY